MNPEQRLVEMIGWLLRTPSSRLYRHTDFRDDLDLDPVDLILLIAQLENHFQVFLTPEEVAAIHTVGDALNYFGSGVKA